MAKNDIRRQEHSTGYSEFFPRKASIRKYTKKKFAAAALAASAAVVAVAAVVLMSLNVVLSPLQINSTSAEFSINVDRAGDERDISYELLSADGATVKSGMLQSERQKLSFDGLIPNTLYKIVVSALGEDGKEVVKMFNFTTLGTTGPTPTPTVPPAGPNPSSPPDVAPSPEVSPSPEISPSPEVSPSPTVTPTPAVTPKPDTPTEPAETESPSPSEEPLDAPYALRPEIVSVEQAGDAPGSTVTVRFRFNMAGTRADYITIDRADYEVDANGVPQFVSGSSDNSEIVYYMDGSTGAEVIFTVQNGAAKSLTATLGYIDGYDNTGTVTSEEFYIEPGYIEDAAVATFKIREPVNEADGYGYAITIDGIHPGSTGFTVQQLDFMFFNASNPNVPIEYSFTGNLGTTTGTTLEISSLSGLKLDPGIYKGSVLISGCGILDGYGFETSIAEASADMQIGMLYSVNVPEIPRGAADNIGISKVELEGYIDDGYGGYANGSSDSLVYAFPGDEVVIKVTVSGTPTTVFYPGAVFSANNDIAVAYKSGYAETTADTAYENVLYYSFTMPEENVPATSIAIDGVEQLFYINARDNFTTLRHYGTPQTALSGVVISGIKREEALAEEGYYKLNEAGTVSGSVTIPKSVIDDLNGDSDDSNDIDSNYFFFVLANVNSDGKAEIISGDIYNTSPNTDRGEKQINIDASGNVSFDFELGAEVYYASWPNLCLCIYTPQ